MIKNKPILPPKTEFKSFHFEQKSMDEDQGIITGYLSTFNNVDLQNDRVLPNAFKKTIAEAKARKQQGRKFIIPVLWFHNPEQPIGLVTDAMEDEKGLLITAQLDISSNAQGVPNNPTATMVFSGFKSGFIDEMSMGYIAIQKDYDKQGVRNLKECALVEASACTALFAANPEAIVPSTGVKMLTKTASGKPSWHLADRDADWDGSKAHNQIVEWATGDDGSIDEDKMKSVHFWYDSENADKITGYKLPFCMIVDGKPQAVPKGIFACAGVMQGSRGGADLGGDDEAVKSKIAAYYKKMAKEFNDDSIKVPWSDDGKRRTMNGQQRKDFNDLYLATRAADTLEDWGDLINTLTQAMMQLLCMGDQPQEDMQQCLGQFSTAVMEWLEMGLQCNLPQYVSDRYSDNTPYVPYSLRVGDDCYGYMSRSKRPDGKVGATISKATQGTLEAHQEEMKASLEAIGDHVKTMQQKVSDLTQLWHEEGQGDPYGNDDDNGGKSRLKRREPPSPALSRQGLQPLHKSTVEDDAITEFINFLS